MTLNAGHRMDGRTDLKDKISCRLLSWLNMKSEIQSIVDRRKKSFKGKVSTPKIIVQLVWAARLLGNFLHSEVKDLQNF